MDSPLAAFIEQAAKDETIRRAPGGRYCCVVGCHNNQRSDGPRGIKFHEFPKNPDLRHQWNKAVNRSLPNKPSSLWQAKQYDVICSSHFVGGEKSSNPSSPSYLPTIFPTHTAPSLLGSDSARQREERRKRRQDCPTSHSSKKMKKSKALQDQDTSDDQVIEEQGHEEREEDGFESIKITIGLQTSLPPPPDSEQMNFCDCPTTTEKSTQISSLRNHLNPKDIGVQVDLSPSILPFSDLSERELIAFCGVNHAILDFLVLRTTNSIKGSAKLTRKMKITLLLMKLKLQVSFDVLAATFNVSSTTAKNVFKNSLDAVYDVAKQGLVWIDKDQIQARMPLSFQALYPDTRVLIDCTEVTCEKPSKVRQKVLMYSNYKSNFTVKYLVGVAPSGEFTFVSRGYGGRATDTFITCNSGFLDLIEEGDVVLADKGFPSIERNVNEAGGLLVMPPFKHGEKQLTSKEIKDGYKCASVRVHVERAIERAKRFKILHFIPVRMIPYIDRAFFIICFLTNLFPDLIKEK